jgi:hypothetical protein
MQLKSQIPPSQSAQSDPQFAGVGGDSPQTNPPAVVVELPSGPVVPSVSPRVVLPVAIVATEVVPMSMLVLVELMIPVS